MLSVEFKLMTSEKARDLFSAYYEGSLDVGLILALEQKFKSDAGLKADYDAFATAFSSLNSLRDEEIEIPIFLSDRIATRMEEARQQKQKPFSLWNLPWLRVTSYGLAALAIIGAGVGILAKGPISEAGFLPWLFGSKPHVEAPIVAPPTFKFDGSNVTLSFQPHSGHTVTISSGTTGNVLRTLTLEDNQPIEPKLSNDNSGSQLFSIREDNSPAQVVAVPGQVSDTSHPTGEGTLGQFAVAVADYYHVPLLLENVQMDTKVKWSFDGLDAAKTANANLEAVHLSADLRDDGMLSINGH